MLSRVVSARRLLSAIRRRPTLSAALAYALLAVALVAPGLLPGHTLSASDYLWSGAPWTAERPAGVQALGSNYEEVDAVTQFQPFLEYAARHMPDVPLWNPHQMGGRPFVANSQSALFTPFNWPSLVLPFWWSLGIAAALKLFAAAFGTFLLARALAIRYAGALMAGLVYGFGLFFVVWLSWPLSSVWAWLPWLLLCIWLVVRRPGPRPVAALALVVALQYFGGHPESSFHVLAAGSFFALLALSRIARGARLRAIGRLAAGLAAGSLLAAIALLPFLELLAHSGDLENRAGRTGGHFPVTAPINYVLPEYWGRPSQAPTQAFAFSRAYYAGALPLMLALWALVSNRSRERVAIAAAGAVAILITVDTPGLFEAVTAVPGFNHAYNQRLIIVGLLALAQLAGWGLGDLLDGVRRPRLLLGGAAVLLVVPVIVALVRVDVSAGAIGDGLATAWGFVEPAKETAKDVVPLGAAWLWLGLAGLALALLWLRASGRVAGAAFTALALGLVVLDLFRVGMGQNPAIPTEHAEQPVTPGLQELLEARPARFVGLAPPVGPQALAPNVAMRYGLYDARGYDFPIERRYNRLWRGYVTDEEDGFAPPTLLASTQPRALAALGLLGVRDIVQPPELPAVPALETVYDGPDARIYRNPDAMPRAWVVGAQRVIADDDEQLLRVGERLFDPRGEAIVSAPVGDVPVAPPAVRGGSACITRYEPDRVELTATSPGRGIAVLSDVHFPGWKATVDGREVPIERVDYLLRGVPVGPGEHRIVMTYRPWSWRAGWIISLLTALGLLAAAMWKGGRR